jgi:hypothetical protein
VDRHLPHDTARNARFFIGIVNAAKMGIFTAGQHSRDRFACLAYQPAYEPRLTHGAYHRAARVWDMNGDDRARASRPEQGTSSSG